MITFKTTDRFARIILVTIMFIAGIHSCVEQTTELKSQHIFDKSRDLAPTPFTSNLECPINAPVAFQPFDF